MTGRILVISNQRANQGNARLVAESLRPISIRNPQVVWIDTAYHNHATELARQAAEDGYYKIVALGGDGTVHQVVNGLMVVPEGRRPRLGIIPVGSGNDFANSLGIPADPAAAMQLALDGSYRPVDIAQIQDESGRNEYWTNTLGIGFDAIVNIRSRAISFARGFWVYFLAALQTILLNHKPMRLQAVEDGCDWEKSLLMLVICNGRREGGTFLVAPQALQNDGLLDYLAIGKISRLTMLYTIPFVMKGTHHRLRYASHGRFALLELNSDRPLYIHTDGEIYAGLDSHLHTITIEVIPGAIQITVPASQDGTDR
jgi:diacylglycerol kinase (ATP)